VTCLRAVSRRIELPVQCSTCTVEYTASLWQVIEADEQPEAWTHCADGTINVAVCPNGHGTEYNIPLLLVDEKQRYNIFVPVFDPPTDDDSAWRIRLVGQVIEQDPSRADYMSTSTLVERAGLAAALASRRAGSGAESARDDPPVVQRSPHVLHLLTELERSGTTANERLGLANELLEAAPDDDGACAAACEAAGAASEERALETSDATYLDDAARAYRAAAQYYLNARTYSGYGRANRRFAVLHAVRARRLVDPFFESSDQGFANAVNYYAAVGDGSASSDVWAERVRFTLAAARRELSLPDGDTETCLRICRERKREIAGGDVQGLAPVLSVMLGDALFHASSGGSKIERLRQAIEAYREAQHALRFPEDLLRWVVLQERVVHTLVEMARYRQPVFGEAIREGGRAVNATVAPMGDLHTRALFLLGLTFSGIPTGEATDRAIEILEQAKKTLRRETDPRLWYEILFNLGGTYLRRNGTEGRRRDDERQATVLIDEISACINITVPSPAESSPLQRFQGLVSLASVDELVTPELLDEAVNLAVSHDDCFPLLERRGLNAGLARTLLARGEYDRAMEAFNRALRAGDLLVRQAATVVQRRYRQDDNEKIDVDVVAAALRRSDPAGVREAFLYAERAKSRWLQESLALIPYPPPASIPDQMRDEERRLLKVVIETELAATELAGGPGHTSILARYEQSLAALEELWTHFDAEYGAREYVAARRANMVDWPTIQRWLEDFGSRVGLLSYFVLDEMVAAFLLRPGGAFPLKWEIPLSKRRVEDIASRFAAEVGAPDAVEETWETLAEPLVAEIAAAASDLDLLYVSKHGPLHALPIHALLAQGRPLAAYVPVAYSNGLGTLLQIQARSRALPRDASGAVVVGDPRRDLPEAEREAHEVAKLLGAEPLIGEQATVANVRAAIRSDGVRTIHFAAHSMFDETDPSASGILLADGVLRASDLAGTSLSAELVVVSGCSSGKSGATSGDEQWGLTRAFSLAGVPTSIIALWDVEDTSAGAIVRDFYQTAFDPNGSEPALADALSAAMLRQRERKARTRYWAPFALYGAS
jgi:CHAT domain-containing protein